MSRRSVVWVAVGLLIAAAGAIVADRYTAHALGVTLQEQLKNETGLLERWIDAVGDDLDPQAFAEDAARALLSRITLLAADGTVVGDSALRIDEVRLMDNHAGRPELVTASSQVTGYAIRRSDTTNRMYLYSARKLATDAPFGFVRIAEPHGGPLRIERPSFVALLAVSIAFTGLLLGFAYIQMRRLSSKVGKLASRLDRPDRLREGDFDTVPELSRLVTSIRGAHEGQAEKLETAVEARRLLDIAVEGLQEGLLLIDKERRVRLANNAARNLLSVDFDPIGALISQIVRNPGVLEAVEIALDRNETPERIAITTDSDRTFDVRVTPLGGQGLAEANAAQVLMLDVTRLRSLERVRQRFVSNVSHELRTPLTAIKAAMETIADESSSSERPFVSMVQRNAEAMEELLEDLTDLSLIETGAVVLDRTEFDLALLAHETAEALRAVAGATEIRTGLDESVIVVGDRRRLRQVLVNLLENAIKFNRDDSPIDLECRKTENGAVIRVRDRGIGIPTTQLDRIFNRFHQVADDRSRKRAGHGMGLAIVKHLVRLHGGGIAVESELSVGSTFAVSLPDDATTGSV